jgi:muconolactone delta-isomerase
MKILALEKEVPEITEEEFAPFLKAEAARVWELYQAGVFRELYFRADWNGAVLVLECGDEDEARQLLNSLPLVKAGLIVFELIPLLPYPGFSRLIA